MSWQLLSQNSMIAAIVWRKIDKLVSGSSNSHFGDWAPTRHLFELDVGGFQFVLFMETTSPPPFFPQLHINPYHTHKTKLS